MSRAAYNRGSRIVAREADERARSIDSRIERQALTDEVTRLQERIGLLERDLMRARRCIAELRRSREARLAEVRADASRSASAISMLCRIAFPGDSK